VARRVDDRISLSGAGTTLDALRALCGVAWYGPRLDAVTASVVPDGAPARTALGALGLDRE
jgi:hypothetical protein